MGKKLLQLQESYAINNGFLSKPIDVSRGNFRGYPVSPILLIFAIEILAIAVRSNDNIKGL